MVFVSCDMREKNLIQVTAHTASPYDENNLINTENSVTTAVKRTGENNKPGGPVSSTPGKMGTSYSLIEQANIGTAPAILKKQMNKLQILRDERCNRVHKEMPLLSTRSPTSASPTTHYQNWKAPAWDYRPDRPCGSPRSSATAPHIFSGRSCRGRHTYQPVHWAPACR